MRKTKKQLLGLAGLATVGIMTAVAYAMPTPDAAAAEQTTYECNDNDDDPANDCAKGGGGAQVQVIVSEGEKPTVRSTYPIEGTAITNKKIKFTGNYNRVSKIMLTLKWVDDNGTGQSGTEHTKTLPDVYPDDDTGTYSVDGELEDQGNYILEVTAIGYNGVQPASDTVAFTYRAMTIEVDPETTPNGDPSVDISINSTVDKVFVQVYNKDKALFVDEAGNPVSIEVSREDIDPATGKIKVHLPFEKYGAEAGEYTVVAVAYDDSGDIATMATAPINYKPVVPEVPNTSAGFLADLNITRIDYLLTGLLVFGLVAGFALYLVCRKSRR